MKKIFKAVFLVCLAAALTFQSLAGGNMDFEYEDVPKQIEEGQRLNFKIGKYSDRDADPGVETAIFKIQYQIRGIKKGVIEYKSGIKFDELYHMELSLDMSELKAGSHKLYISIDGFNEKHGYGTDWDLIEFEVVPRGSLPPSSKPESSPEPEKPANPNTGAYLLLSGASGAALLSAASAAVFLKRKRKKAR